MKLSTLTIKELRTKKPAEIELILDQRRSTWKPREPKYKTGVLGLFTANAASPMKGGYMD